MLFRDRSEAGRLLARLLSRYRGRDDVRVLALPRGGVPVAAEIAAELGAPLDVLVVRKLGVPEQPELAMGAVAFGGVRYVNERIVALTGVTDEEIDAVARAETKELARREQEYRRGRPALEVGGKIAIVVDDGLATGATMIAATSALRTLGPARIVVAVPTAPPSVVRTLQAQVDEVVCLATPEPYLGVGQWYLDFRQIDDIEVVALLAQHGTEEASHAHA